MTARAARVRVGSVWVDALSFDEAVARVGALVERGRGGAVFTPNVDHVVAAERAPLLRAAYGRAELSLADGQPIVWASRLLGHSLPAKISGSDLLVPVLRMAGVRGYRVYLLGGAEGLGARAAERIERELGCAVCGVDSARIGLTALPDEDAVLARVAAAGPHLLLVFLGAPKGERFIDRARPGLGSVVALSLGASLDFYMGRVRRAPPWMSRAGLEWAFRLAHEPRRLARRYLWDDPRFVRILVDTLRLPRSARVAAM